MSGICGEDDEHPANSNAGTELVAFLEGARK